MNMKQETKDKYRAQGIIGCHESAEILGIKPRRVSDLVKRGKIRAYFSRAGAKHATGYYLEDIEKYKKVLERRKRTTLSNLPLFSNSSISPEVPAKIQLDPRAEFLNILEEYINYLVEKKLNDMGKGQNHSSDISPSEDVTC